MIPFLLAVIGGYLLGDSMKDSETFAKGGGIKSFMYRVRFKNRSEESFSAYNLKDLKEQIIAKFGSTDDVWLVERWDLKNRHYNVVESTRGKKFDDGGMADGGEIRRFDRHEQMDSETRGDILDTINEFYLIEGFSSLKNYLYGLFDGYDYSQTDSFKEAMKKLESESKSLHDRIEKIYQKIDKYSFAKGGKTKDMSVQFIDYKGKTIMFEPHFKQYFTNDIEFKTLAEAKQYIDAGSPDPSWEKFVYAHGLMVDGGEVKNYLFNFMSGGYNTISAKNKRDAIKKAKEKYEDDKSKIDVKSFRIATKKDLDIAESMFR